MKGGARAHWCIVFGPAEVASLLKSHDTKSSSNLRPFVTIRSTPRRTRVFFVVDGGDDRVDGRRSCQRA